MESQPEVKEEQPPITQSQIPSTLAVENSGLEDANRYMTAYLKELGKPVKYEPYFGSTPLKNDIAVRLEEPWAMSMAPGQKKKETMDPFIINRKRQSPPAEGREPHR